MRPATITIARRSVLRAAVAALALPVHLLAEDMETNLEVGGAKLEISFDPHAFDLSEADLLGWVRKCATAVTAYFGKFPVAHARIRLVARGESGVSGGRTFGEGGARSRLSLGPHTGKRDLEQDWMLTHEMVHYAFPSVEENHHWIEEGTATYVEPIARVQSGWLTSEQVWSDVIRDMHQGLPQEGDEGLDRTHTWGRTYWGGALFCLLADIEIRKKTSNRKGLQDALRAIDQAGGTIENDWPLDRALALGDKSTGTDALSQLYAKMGSHPMPVDLPKLWKNLGITRSGTTVTFDSKAPLAAVREAIMAGHG